MVQSKRADQTVPMCGITTAVFRVIHRKRQNRKQNPVRKNADSRGNSRKKIVLRGWKRSQTATLLTIKQKAVFPFNRTLLRMTTERNRLKMQKNLRTITAAGILTTEARKRADTADVNIRTGSVQKNQIPGMTFRQKTIRLQKAIPLPMVQNRNFRVARN